MGGHLIGDVDDLIVRENLSSYPRSAPPFISASVNAGKIRSIATSKQLEKGIVLLTKGGCSA